MEISLLNILWAALSSFLITYITIPYILDVAYTKNIFDVPDERKLHTRQIPSLGGIGIFFGFLISFTFFTSADFFGLYKYIITAYVILFFMGLKDDLVPMEAKVKLLLQFLAAFIITFGGVRISSLFGLFGIYELNTFFSFVVSMLFIVVVTNAFNLIDGIDGLAAGIGGINCLALGGLLIMVDELNFAILAFSVGGTLVAFLRYNFAAYPQKIFMGDAGSLLLGLTASILCIQFMGSVATANSLSIVSPIVVVAAIIFIPVFDLLRVSVLRILQGKSPFSADNSHIHHELLSSGLNHKNASITLYVANILFIMTAFFFRDQSFLQLFLLLLVVGVIIVQVLFGWRYLYRRSQLYDLKDRIKHLEKENYLIEN